MFLNNLFHREVIHKTATNNHYLFSPAEAKSIRNTFIKGSRVMKSFRHGRALTDNNAGVTGLAVKDGGTAPLAENSNIMQWKRYLGTLSKNPIIQAILRTRCSQLMKFCQPTKFNVDDVGYTIRPKHLSPDGKLTKQQKKDIQRISRFIYHTGVPDAERPSRDTFPQFVTKFVRNKFIYDQINVEKVYDKNNKNKLDHFNMVDAGSIVLAKTPKNQDDPRVFYQIVRHNIGRNRITRFDEHHMSFVTYHGGEIQRHGYGFSPIEAALQELGYEADTESFNARFFRQGGTTRGILLLDPGPNGQQSVTMALKHLRQQWQSTAQGLTGAWKIPVITGANAKFINMTQNSKDMEFEHWLDYLINIICAECQMQPDEINFPNRGGTSNRGGGSMNEGSTEKNKMRQSRDKGLYPLLLSIQHFMNDHIMSHYSPNYYFLFSLGDSRNEQRRQTIEQLKEDNGMTVNEYRQEQQLPPLKTFNDAFDKLPGPPKIVVQELNLIMAQQKTQDQNNQNLSDIQNATNPNHQQNSNNQQATQASQVKNQND